jgi:hypothetical protein
VAVVVDGNLTLGCGAICTTVLAGGCAARLGTSATNVSCPYGEVNDPYPGKCHRYVDQSGSGVCDYSEFQDAASSLPTATVEANVQTDDAADRSAPARATTCCPKRLVSDPYPVRCRHYIDRDGSGFCDLSETA